MLPVTTGSFNEQNKIVWKDFYNCRSIILQSLSAQVLIIFEITMSQVFVAGQKMEVRKQILKLMKNKLQGKIIFYHHYKIQENLSSLLWKILLTKNGGGVQNSYPIFKKRAFINLSMCFITYKILMASLFAFKRDTSIGVTYTPFYGIVTSNQIN